MKLLPIVCNNLARIYVISHLKIGVCHRTGCHYPQQRLTQQTTTKSLLLPTFPVSNHCREVGSPSDTRIFLVKLLKNKTKMVIRQKGTFEFLSLACLFFILPQIFKINCILVHRFAMSDFIHRL